MDKRRDGRLKKKLTKLLCALLSVSYRSWDAWRSERHGRQAEMIGGHAIKTAATHADQMAARTALDAT